MITPLQAIPSANSCARLTGKALMLLRRLRTVPMTRRERRAAGACPSTPERLGLDFKG